MLHSFNPRRLLSQFSKSSKISTFSLVAPHQNLAGISNGLPHPQPQINYWRVYRRTVGDIVIFPLYYFKTVFVGMVCADN